ncbi:hypothetical protein [Fibrisoma montanum]|nr:hypothetical protein [Fibrisoma montanum]
MEPYIRRIENGALPLVSVLKRNDSTFIYISATISANSIQKSIPSYISWIDGREVAVYNGTTLISAGKEACVDTMVRHFRNLLTIDRKNALAGRPAGEKFYYGYDPPWVKITMRKDKIIMVRDSGELSRTIPYYKFEF